MITLFSRLVNALRRGKLQGIHSICHDIWEKVTFLKMKRSVAAISQSESFIEI